LERLSLKAVLLAAGEGVRLLPITATRPKHLIRVGGKPILEHCFDALKANGVTEALIVTHYMGDAIRAYFGDGSKFGLKIEYAQQEAVLGTGNAAGIAEPFVSGDFLLVYGDLLFSAQAVKSVIDVYKLGKPASVMAVVPVDKPESYGIIELAKDKTVKRIVEKPARGKAPSNLANAGLYVFGKDLFDALRRVKRSVRGEWELTDAVTLLAKESKKVLAAEIAKSDWFDVGRPWDLLDANVWALRRVEHRVLGNVEQGAHLFGPVTVAETARVRSGAYIEGPCFIDEGADVGPNCFIRACTSIGKNVRVGNACEVKNSIIMDGTHVGHLSYVGDSILGDHCNLGAGTITANLRLDDGSVKMIVKDRVVDTGRRKLGAILGDNVKTAIGALLMPGVKVGNDSWIGVGYVVERDLPANTIAVLKQSGNKQEQKK
jgi:UDP-N-acetylglucosamine diphosphorylase / glucose-1-phosphate thymidylyltransferase / UDP-N-acetylgalactosamine diphosphorylase / glucosamine-1-phosphate N-acetyltransferase / galactosamine-1-phosphate N-acetyltransferase